ncbi:nucleoside hydrolase [Corynespora cassiicola Philippines]|uniref:Nucleoside hydrolase n=1 Tax=Corynespora cassiicola Philippines TaxID=1448308 RepID=A0A2T2NH39_CORCC|nr:nucleoside hydrolase [Corynespora cassiicola Philippines]
MKTASFFQGIPGPRSLLKYAATYLSLARPIAHANNTTNLIVDTDLFSDVDDAGALLLASTLPHTNLLAVNINVNSTYSALCASALLAHYNHSHVPIGLPRPYANTSFFDTWAYTLGEYASKIAYHWRDNGGQIPWFAVNDTTTWDPVDLYRKTLSEAQDGSVTIASIGFFGSLSGLLNSTADAHSPLPGPQLVERKVRKLVVMGGGYPSGHEFNFWGDNPSYTAHVVNSWPHGVPVTFLGTEIGEVVSTGARLSVEGPPSDPVARGYAWYVGYNSTRFSWDPLTVVYAIRGLGSWFEYGNVGGYNYVFANGSNVWVEDEGRTEQHYLKLRMGNQTVAGELDGLLLEGARAWER